MFFSFYICYNIIKHITFNYNTDYVTLLAPTGMALNVMLDTCTRFADSHNLLFNSSKTKCMFFYISRSQLIYIVIFD